jgi:hypothetical protein
MSFNICKSGLLSFVRWFDSIFSKLPRLGSFRPLRGVFSAAQALEENRLHGEFLLRSQDPGPCRPGSLTELVAMRQHDHQPWPIFWVRSDDAQLVGRMLYWRNSEDYLCSEGVFHTPKRRRLKEDQLFAQIFPLNPHKLPGAWTSIVSNWGNGGNYFHWFCDSLTRLLVREQLPEETRILIPADPPGFVKETIEMLGLSDLCLEAPASCVQPERFYFCSPTAMTGVWNPIGFDWLREKFARFRQPTANGRPIFLTRRGETRIPANISAIEALFSENGFEIIDCGKHTVKEQIRLASAAPAIAGLHGAAMTNILWAQTNTPVLEIFQPEYLNACYEQIALQGELAYNFHTVDASSGEAEILHWIEHAI